MGKKYKFLFKILAKYWQGAESHSSNPHNPYSKLIKTQFQNTHLPTNKNNINYGAESHSSTPLGKSTPIGKSTPLGKSTSIDTSTNK
jgi:hypothetical protein